MTSDVRDHFLNRPFVGGLTNEGHALACAAGIANIRIYEDEQLIAKSASLGEHLKQRLNELYQRHISVGDVRGRGLFACLELTSDRTHKHPLAGYADRIANVSMEITGRLRRMGLIVIAKWDYIFIAPPLIISREEIDDGVDKIDVVLDYTDQLAGNRCN